MSQKLRPYRCYNRACMKDRKLLEFWSETGACPSCDASAEGNPDVVVRMEIIHFNPPHPRIKTSAVATHKGTGMRACTPNIEIGKGHATVNPRLVNCPKCRQTPVFEKTLAEWDEGENVTKGDFEFAIQKTAAGDQVIVKSQGGELCPSKR